MVGFLGRIGEFLRSGLLAQRKTEADHAFSSDFEKIDFFQFNYLYKMVNLSFFK